jgi:excisionase family DNA binding protein
VRSLLYDIQKLDYMIGIGMENAGNLCKLKQKGCKPMQNELGTSESVLTTNEACSYLRISRPTYLKYLYEGRIKGAKAGKGWKVLKSELDRFLRGENGN